VDIARTLASDGGDDAHGDVLFWSSAIQRCFESWRCDLEQTNYGELKERLLTLKATAGSMAEAMEFGFLLDPQRRLLSIGYRAADGTLEPELLTTCSLPRRGLPASSRSQRATSRHAIGSALVDRLRLSVMARR